VASPDTDVRRSYPGIPAGATVAGGIRGLSLNNSGDLLLLFDDWGDAVDRVSFLPDWHTPALDETRGRSLERIDPSGPGNEGWNWGSSAGAGGGTPGAPNSLAPAARGAGPGLECAPNPFSPDGDGHEDVTLISFRPGTGQAIARVRIYDAAGRPVRTLTAGGYIGPGGSFAWNGYDDRGRKAPIGIYVVVADAVDGTGERAVSLRGVVVVAGRL
jgi:hypothetical protein